MENPEYYLPLLMILALAVLLFSGFPVGFVLAGVGVLFCGLGFLLGEFPWVAFYNIPLRVYGAVAHSIIFPAIPMLLLMGVAFEKSGAARDMLLCLQVLLKKVPGQLAISVTVLGILLGPLPGLVGISVATLALLAIPTMLEQTYKPSVATGCVAAAGSLGVIIPPSVMLFFLSSQMRVSMGHVFLGVLIPSLTLSGLYLLYYLFRGIIDAKGRPAPNIKVPEGGALGLFFFAVQNLVLPVALIGMVLGSIIWGLATPSQSGALGAAGGLVLMLIKGKFTLPNLHDVIKKTALMTSMVFFIVMAANVFSYPFRYFGGDDLIANFLWGLGLNDWGGLLAVLGIIFVLGFFIDWIEITIITLPIFLPVLENLDMTPHLLNPELTKLWMGVLIALVLQTSFMTPPFGFALFFVKGASPPSVKLSDVYRGAIPLVGIQLTTLFLVMGFPLLATWLPHLVFD